jgi:hypothetical protein
MKYVLLFILVCTAFIGINFKMKKDVVVVLNSTAFQVASKLKENDLFAVIGGVYETNVIADWFKGEEVDLSYLSNVTVHCGNMKVESLDVASVDGGFVVDNIHMNTRSIRLGEVYSLTVMPTKTFSSTIVSKVKVKQLSFDSTPSGPSEMCRGIILSRSV